MSNHFRLERLALDGNLIGRVSGIENLTALRVLSLRGNRISRVGGLGNLPLVELDLGSNRLKRLERLDGLGKLQILKVAGNSITSLAGLEKCGDLLKLDAADNEIPRVREAEHLRSLPRFADLTLKGNPCASLPFARRRVIFCLQTLHELDGDPVTPDEKVKSINIHGGDESDLGHRKEMYKKYFGGDSAWENTLPPFVETEPTPLCDAAASARMLDNLVAGALADATLDAEAIVVGGCE